MPDVVLASGLAISLITDLKMRKIYNIVLLPLFVFGLAYNFVISDWSGLWQSILGTLIGLGILMIPFALGGIGAGDVKLLAVIGTIKGPVFVFYTALGMGLGGGILALLIIAFQGKIFATIKNLFGGILVMFISGFKVIRFEFDNKKTTLPYGVAIVMGAASAYWWMG